MSFSNVSSSTTGRVLTKVAGHDLNSPLFFGGAEQALIVRKVFS